MNTVDYDSLFASFSGSRGDLIPLLQQVQEVEGYVSPQSVKAIARFLKLSENEIFGVASFYAQFRFIQPGKHSIHICLGTACHVQGGPIIQQAIERKLGISTGDITPDRRFDIQRVACLGCCSLAPVVKIDNDIYSHVNVDCLDKMLSAYE